MTIDIMSEWVSFEYREFYDIPRMLIFTFRGRILLLKSSFDEEDDEYSKKYSVYELSPSSMEQLEDSWEGLESQALSCLGEISVETVKFDPTRRNQIDVDALKVLGV